MSVELLQELKYTIKMIKLENLTVLDCEVYPNYFLVSFKQLSTGKLKTVEIRGCESTLDQKGASTIHTLMNRYTTFGFNSLNYDIPVILYALKGKTASQICELSNYIIKENSKGWMTMNAFNLNNTYADKHFDIMEPAPAVGVGLKQYGGRLHSKRLQELPIKPNTMLTEVQMDEIKDYCENDLNTTIDLYYKIEESLELRVKMSETYGVDLVSKSDAQIGEAVIKSELKRLNPRLWINKPKFDQDFTFNYKIPPYINFKSKALIEVAKLIDETTFKLTNKGKVDLPDSIGNYIIKIGETDYKIGLGGLHSQEKNVNYECGDDDILVDRDVTSYYPAAIINLEMFPKHLSATFIEVYRNIVEERVKAKREKDTIKSDSLKIVANGSFGKFGSRWSALYSPDLLIATTLTGQLSLLMLIEELEGNGIHVVSANTDGFVSFIKKWEYGIYDTICEEWSKKTNFNLEETRYKGLYSRDVNCYFATLYNGSYKAKSVFNVGSIRNNPAIAICAEAAIKLVINKIPVEKTIRECVDVSKFISLKKVTNGAMYKGEYLGKVVRWIYVKDGDEIRGVEGKLNFSLIETKKEFERLGIHEGLTPKEFKKIKTIKAFQEHFHNHEDKYIEVIGEPAKVAKADGCRPLMEFPDEFPTDIDYDRYIAEAKELLTLVNYLDL